MNDEWKLSWARGKRKFPNGGYTKTILMWRNMLSTRHREKAVWLVWTRWVGSIWDDAGEVGWGRIVQKLINNVRDRYLYSPKQGEVSECFKEFGCVSLWGIYLSGCVHVVSLYPWPVCLCLHLCFTEPMCLDEWHNHILFIYLTNTWALTKFWLLFYVLGWDLHKTCKIFDFMETYILIGKGKKKMDR